MDYEELSCQTEIRRKFAPEFGEGAVRIVRETKKPIAVIARDLGVNPGTPTAARFTPPVVSGTCAPA